MEGRRGAMGGICVAESRLESRTGLAAWKDAKTVLLPKSGLARYCLLRGS